MEKRVKAFAFLTFIFVIDFVAVIRMDRVIQILDQYYPAHLMGILTPLLRAINIHMVRGLYGIDVVEILALSVPSDAGRHSVSRSFG